MNVRCPNCSAVFPAAGASTPSAQVECPICLLRFEPVAEETMSLPQMPPVPPTGAAALGGDDEFESFGGAGLSQTTTVVRRPPRAVAPREDSQPVDRGKQVSDLHEIGFDDAGDSIDFSALLSDAVSAVERPAEGHRTNPFGRVSAPRKGGPAVVDDVLGARRPSAPELPRSTAGDLPFGGTPSAGLPLGGLGDDLFEPGSAPALDDGFAVPVLSGRDEPLEPAAARPEPREPRHRPAQRARKKSSKAGPALVTLALALLAVGGGLDLAGYGFFGVDLWLPQDGDASRRPSAQLTAELLEPLPLDDTRQAYEAEIRRLETVVALRTDDAELLASLADRYLDLLERFPEAFQEDPGLRKRVEVLQTLVQPFPPRLAALDALTAGDLDGVAAALPALEQGSLDDKGVAVRARLEMARRRVREQALGNPGLTANPEADPTRARQPDDPDLKAARGLLEGMQQAVQGAPNRTKHVVLLAAVRDQMHEVEPNVAPLSQIVEQAPGHVQARLLLASAHLERNELPQARIQVEEALRLASEPPQPALQHDAQLVAARVATRQGDRSGLIQALLGAVAAKPDDELATIRLGRLLMAEKRSDEAQKLLVASKKAGFQSVAFSVVLVEYWLQANRNDDALEALKEATRLYPESVDLLFLRGQVEDKQQHFATARDYFAQVIAREPRHLRAILRLAELQGAANRHDEALATLTRARELLGDDEMLLGLLANELVALQRQDEARQVFGRLLALQPHNRSYLLQAARMDLQRGEVDQALGYLRQLRDQRALDRDGAMQLALALATKGQTAEAAEAVVPFAQQATSDVELNTLAGRLLMESKDLDRAATLLERAAAVSGGRNPETMYQFGRLAFRRGEITQGITRMRQAIEYDPSAWPIRLTLARELFDLANFEKSRELAVAELQTIIGGEKGYAAAGRPVTEFADIHRLMARHYLEQHRFEHAVPHLQAVLRHDPEDVESLVALGRSLHMVASPDAPKVLKAVLARRPGDGRAALYLGLAALNNHRSSEAMGWFQKAARDDSPQAAEAVYHMALIHKERAQHQAAAEALERYLQKASADDTYRREAERLLATYRKR